MRSARQPQPQRSRRTSQAPTAGSKRLLVAAVAALAVIAVASAVAVSSCTDPGTPHVAHSGPTGPVSFVAEPSPDRMGTYGHDIVSLTARGGDFSHATEVVFEVLNTSDPKAKPFLLDAHKDGSSWTAEIDPALSGVGTYHIVARGTGPRGDAFTSELDYTCTIEFEPATEIHVVGGDYDVSYGMAGLKVLRIQQVFGNGVDNYPRYTCTIEFEPATEIHVVGGDYDVSYGMAGLKVLRIQQVFGNGVDNYPRYLDDTEQRVKDFQKRHNLPVTGVVDRETWLALGLDPMEWYTLGAYVSPVAVGENPTDEQRIDAMIGRARDYLGDTYIWDAAGAPGKGIDCAGVSPVAVGENPTDEQRIDAMIGRARDYLGDTYIWDAAGAPGKGIDCAGLVIQGLYAAGWNPGILNPVTHSTTSWGDQDAANLYSYCNLAEVDPKHLVIQGLYAAGWNPGILNPVTHSTTSWGDQDAANLYSYCNLAEVDPKHLKRGDLVFYGKDGVVDHVAIYIGNDQVIEAHPKGVRIADAAYRPIMGARRIFG